MEKKEEFHTWENWCLRKLKEIGRSGPQRWAEAMGCEFAASMAGIIRNNIDKLTVTTSFSGRRKFYEVKEGVNL